MSPQPIESRGASFRAVPLTLIFCVGCNVENASYPLCTCAERVAICNAVSQGSKEIEAISVVT